MGGRLLGIGRNCGRIQLRVAAAYRGDPVKASSFAGSFEANTAENEAAGAEARGAHRWLLSRERVALEAKAHASAIRSIDFSVADEFDPRATVQEHGSRNATRFEGLAFRCALKTSDVSREVRFFQANLLRSTVDYVPGTENEINMQVAHRSAVWRARVTPAQAVDCRDAVYPSWTCLYGFQVLRFPSWPLIKQSSRPFACAHQGARNLECDGGERRTIISQGITMFLLYFQQMISNGVSFHCVFLRSKPPKYQCCMLVTATMRMLRETPTLLVKATRLRLAGKKQATLDLNQSQGLLARDWFSWETRTAHFASCLRLLWHLAPRLPPCPTLT